MSAATEHIRIPKAATSEAKFFVIDSMEALHKEDKLLSGEICRWLLDVIKITLPCADALRRLAHGQSLPARQFDTASGRKRFLAAFLHKAGQESYCAPPGDQNESSGGFADRPVAYERRYG